MEKLKSSAKFDERTGKFADLSDPWKYTKERSAKQANCTCKHDPGRMTGTCGTCGGWRD